MEKIDIKKLLHFDPTDRDGLVMFALYISLIMFLYGNNGIGIVFAAISIFVYLSKKTTKAKPCRESSIDNPYGNTLMENDNMDACPTDPMVQDENFQNNLYRNESDLFDRKSLQLNYFQEEKVYPGDINKMLKYYDSNKKCKYVNINCDVPNFFIN
jgi:hypothetical protein